MLTKSNWGGGHLRKPHKKGFTLIELLAVIIILAVISLITIPVIINTIEESRKKAFKDSVILTSREIDNYMINHDDFNYQEDELITIEQLKSVVKHKFTSGGYKVVNGKLEAYFISDGKYCAMGPVTELQISKDCISLDQTKPNIDVDKISIESDESTVIVRLSEGLGNDPESGIKEYRVSIYEGENIVNTKSLEKIEGTETITFNNLTITNNYKVIVVVENGNGITNSVEIALNKPTTQVSPERWAQAKTVTIIYPVGYTNEYSIDGGLTWNEYENPIEIINNNTTVIAKINDGAKYVTSITQTVSQIDKDKPTVANVSKKSTTSKSITVTASGTDPDSGIYGYQFSSDDGDTWTEVQRDNEYTFSDLTSGTYKIKVKVINNTYSNNGINKDNSKVSSVNSISTDEIPTPTYTTNPNTTYAQSKTVTIDYHDVDTYTHEYSLNGGTTWQTYTEPLVFNANGTVLARITDGTNTVTGYISGSSYSVSGIDTTPPSAEATIKTKTTSTVVIEATCTDSDSGITKIEYSNGNGWIDNGTEEHYKFTNLTAGQSYDFKVRCTNGSLLTKESAEATGQAGNASIAFNPTRTPDDTTWATSVSVPVTYTIANVTSPTRYIRSNVAGTKLNINAVACGDDTTPGTCTDTLNANTAMAKDVWYKVEENPTVTVAVTTSNLTLTGVIHDGDSYLTSVEQQISNIDISAPSASASIGERTTTSVVVNATCVDSDSNISKIEYQKDNGSWIDNRTTTSYTFSSLSQGTSYDFKVRCTNGSGIQKESSVATGVTKATAVFNGNGGTDGTSITTDVGEQLGELSTSTRSYTITYDTNSQDATSSKENETVTYTFDGWYTGQNDGTQISASTTMPSGGKTYYAHWTSASTTLATITKTGYTCTWNTKTDGTGTSYASGATNYIPTSTHTLYARCTINQYTVVFNGNGGSNGTSITKNYNEALGNLPTSTRTNYKFVGWFTEASGGTQVTTSTTMPLDGTTYYAHWNKTVALLNVGDLVSMTPSGDSFTPTNAETGYDTRSVNERQLEINPKELTLWRVIRKNSNGTVDMISEYTSSNPINFSGVNGYNNYVYSLNIYASYYENSDYTVKSRTPGYISQTATTTFVSNTTCPQNTCEYTNTSDNSKESLGCGDVMYTTDTNLIKAAYSNSLVAKTVNDKSTVVDYYLASRNYRYVDSNNGYRGSYYYEGMGISTTGEIKNFTIFMLYSTGYSTYASSQNCRRINLTSPVFSAYLRPIVTIKSGLGMTGSGTSASPYVLYN